MAVSAVAGGYLAVQFFYDADGLRKILKIGFRFQPNLSQCKAHDPEKKMTALGGRFLIVDLTVQF
eukprot:CAMPEP_0170172806 /NCGR_PEP_ID=MMETSP0040_2-20121228/6072_1 /TAXON_ID=641309 /ORGANISM="Lotharella oceanica, Strain CCMP622" /LENGTH=64 /DNA_ID=CAMNT_0010413655 /DNA_START=1026 /DNA_END=1221 /DNA_ORIENTATION=-